MKNRNIRSFASLLAIAVVLFATACNNTNSSQNAGPQALASYLTVGPGLFDKVLVDIKSVKVLVDTTKDTRKHDDCDFERLGANVRKNDSGFVWTDSGIKAGIYD